VKGVRTFSGKGVKGCQFSKFSMWKGPDSPKFSMWKGKGSGLRAEHPRMKLVDRIPPGGRSLLKSVIATPPWSKHNKRRQEKRYMEELSRALFACMHGSYRRSMWFFSRGLGWKSNILVRFRISDIDQSLTLFIKSSNILAGSWPLSTLAFFTSFYQIFDRRLIQ